MYIGWNTTNVVYIKREFRRRCLYLLDCNIVGGSFEHYPHYFFIFVLIPLEKILKPFSTHAICSMLPPLFFVMGPF